MPNLIMPGVSMRDENVVIVLKQLALILSCAALLAAQAPPARRAADYLREAGESFQRADYAAARSAANQALGVEPGSAVAWKLLGMSYAAEDRLEDALQPFVQACETNPREPAACYYLGRTAHFLSRLDLAEQSFRKAMSIAADRPRATLGLALVKEADAAPEEAERLFRQALQLKAAGALLTYGQFLYRQGRHQEAMDAFQRAGAPEDLARVRQELAAAPRAGPLAKPDVHIVFESTQLPGVVLNSATGNKHLVETMMGGVAILDFDNDGLPDIYVTNGAALPSLEKSGERYWNRLLHNRGDGSFEDLTVAAGVSGRGYAMGASAGDFDGDGWLDLFVFGVNANILYRNQGNGSFQELTHRAGVAGDGKWSVGAAWLDYNRDGRLDLFVARYVEWDVSKDPYCGERQAGHRTYCHPRLYQPLHNLLYRNEGDGRFRDVSVETGIAAHPGKAMGVAVGDFDNNGWPDIFVGNDTVPNFLFMNRGGKFHELATESGVALPGDGRPISSMGASVADIDQDGHEDLIVTALSNETFPLFRNLGKAQFQDITAASGIAAQSLPYSGWGVGFADLDNDGFPDIFTANGHVMDNAELTSSRPSKQPNTVLRNLGGGRFALHALPGEAFHRGAAFADFNRDGRIDAVVSRLNDTPLLLTNRTENTGNWLSVMLPFNAVGARLQITGPRGHQAARFAPHFSYASSSEHSVHFGLGADKEVERLTITWPDGCIQTVQRPAINQFLKVNRACRN